MMSLTRPAATLAAAVLPAIFASVAAATPALEADRTCYSTYGDTPIRVAGTGFTPGAPLRITGRWIEHDGSARNGGSYTSSADGAGAFVDSNKTPDPGFGEQLRFSVTIQDLAAITRGAPPPEQAAAVTFRVSSFGAAFEPWNTDGPARARPGRSAVLRAGGYIDSHSRTLYVHYLRRGRLVKTLRVGHLDGSCRRLTTRLREFDFRPLRPGTYSVRFDTTRTFPNDDKWSAYRRVALSARDIAPTAGRRSSQRGGQ